MSDEELELLLAKRRRELERLLREKQRSEAKRQEEIQRETILRQILTSEARERLARIKLARPEFGAFIENQLISLALSGRLRGIINDAQLKEILKQYLRQFSRESKIEIRRK